MDYQIPGRPRIAQACTHDLTGRTVETDDRNVVTARCAKCGAVTYTFQAANEVSAHVIATREQRDPGCPF